MKKPRKEKPRSQKARKLITQELTTLLREEDKKGGPKTQTR